MAVNTSVVSKSKSTGPKEMRRFLVNCGIIAMCFFFLIQLFSNVYNERDYKEKKMPVVYNEVLAYYNSVGGNRDAVVEHYADKSAYTEDYRVAAKSCGEDAQDVTYNKMIADGYYGVLAHGFPIWIFMGILCLLGGFLIPVDKSKR